MDILNIDSTRCARDGICEATCPKGVIKMTDNVSYPSQIEGAENFCLECGHCVVICPNGALSLKTMKPGDCTTINKDLLPNAEQCRHFLFSRRSIRRYKQRPVDREILTDIIDTARYAPSVQNKQLVNWIVIEDTTELIRLSAMVIDWMRTCLQKKPGLAESFHMDHVVDAWERGENRICRNAPHAIVAHSHKKNSAIAETSSTIAFTYLQLAAFSMDIGTCWSGYLKLAFNFYPPILKSLNLPEGHQCFAAMLIGYPKYKEYRIPLRKKAKITWI